MENIKSETKANVDQMKAELLRLNNKRAEWEGGAFKRSNEQLYAVLEECHKLLVQLRADVKMRKKLNAAIEANGYLVRSNTSIELKVVRAVFGIENNRIQAYTSVLLIAKKTCQKIGHCLNG